MSTNEKVFSVLLNKYLLLFIISYIYYVFIYWV